MVGPVLGKGYYSNSHRQMQEGGKKFVLSSSFFILRSSFFISCVGHLSKNARSQPGASTNEE
jgi:hypothetical protein